MRSGVVNVDQAMAVSRAAVWDPTAEGRLVSQAFRDSLAGLQDHCKRTVAAARADDPQRNERIRRERAARTRIDEEGGYHLELSTAGAIIEAALNPYRELAFEAARKSGRRESFDAYTADAVEMLCAAAIGSTPTCILETYGRVPATAAATRERVESDVPAHLFTEGEPAVEPPDPVPEGGLDPDGPSPPGDPPAPPAVDLTPVGTVIPWDPTGAGIKLPAGARIDITVLISHTALARGKTAPGEASEIAGLGPVPVTTVQELIATGDPFYAAVIEKGEDLTTGVHLGRQPRAVQRTAVVARDRGTCSIAGCTNTICEVDHNDDYSHVRKTEFKNLRLLCTQIHHPMKTAGGTLWQDDHGDLRLTPPPGWNPETKRREP